MYILLYFGIGVLLCMVQAYIDGFSKDSGEDVFFTLLLLLMWPVMIALLIVYYVLYGLGVVLERISKLK
jgi:hypothetical protein